MTKVCFRAAPSSLSWVVYCESGKKQNWWRREKKKEIHCNLGTLLYTPRCTKDLDPIETFIFITSTPYFFLWVFHIAVFLSNRVEMNAFVFWHIFKRAWLQVKCCLTERRSHWSIVISHSCRTMENRGRCCGCLPVASTHGFQATWTDHQSLINKFFT